MTTKAKTDVIGLGLVLIPYYSIIRIGGIFIEGLRYGKNNWKKGVNDKEYQEERLEHAMRHLFLWKEGDKEEDHLAKVAWFCVTQMELERIEDNDYLTSLEKDFKEQNAVKKAEKPEGVFAEIKKAFDESGTDIKS